MPQEYGLHRFLVYNMTRESFLSFGVIIVDITLQPLKLLFQKLNIQTATDLWFTPYSGIPAIQEVAPIDLVYLTENYRVIQTVESVPSVFAEPLIPQVASVLVLPPHAIDESQTEAADQLMICEADEMERRLQLISSQAACVPQGQCADLPLITPADTDGSGSLLPGDHYRQIERAAQKLKEKEKAQSKAPEKDSLISRFLQWLETDNRKARRFPLPGLVACYWTADKPNACSIADISATGLYLITDERWFPGSLIPMTLQRAGSVVEDPKDWIPVMTQVVRSGSDGRGLAFVFSRFVNLYSGEIPPERGTDKKALQRFLKQLNLAERNRQNSRNF